MAHKTKLKEITPLTDEDFMPEGEPIFPRIHFREIDLPEIKDWPVGEDYYVVVKIHKKEVYEMPGGELEASFEMKEVGDVTSEYA